MYAIEFQTRIKDGVIEIPEEYRDRFRQIVKVILLAEEQPLQSDIIDQLLVQPIEVADFKPLSREEIHERR